MKKNSGIQETEKKKSTKGKKSHEEKGREKRGNGQRT